VVYLFIQYAGHADDLQPTVGGKFDLFCITAGNNVNSVRQAEKLIDRILDGGEYAYNLDAPVAQEK
jgi:hypothetical protein